MASLRELFDGEFGQFLKVNGQTTFSSSKADCDVLHRLYCDFDTCACLLSCYISNGCATPELLHAVVEQHDKLVSILKSTVAASSGHIAIYQSPGPYLKDLPFNGRIILYVDALLDDGVRQGLVALGTTLGVWVQIRDRRYEEHVTMHETPLGFVSHDSRDKDSFVRPLADKMRSIFCPVWYDEYSMKPGDSLRESIDAGLHNSKKCIVVLSQNFFTNPGWAKGEFNAIVNKHFAAGGNVLIPIWYGVTRDEVAAYSELVADIVAITETDLEKIVGRLRQLLLAK